jgi:hypothetical protein
MVQGQGQYMGAMIPQGGLGANGMMGGQMAQMGGRAGDLDNGTYVCHLTVCVTSSFMCMCQLEDFVPHTLSQRLAWSVLY